jgi:AcrR family transcriptional regulator
VAPRAATARARAEEGNSSPTDLRAADGRVPGRRGLATRQRLLDCTAALLATTSYRDLKVTDISREAGTSPATFYHYFPDIESALTVLAQATADRGAELAELVGEEPWRGAAGYDAALRLVDGTLAFWGENAAVLRVVDLLAKEGDEGFRQIRTRMLNSTTRALADAVLALRERDQKDDIDPTAMAAVLVSMLAHVAEHQPGLSAASIPLEGLRESMARLVYGGVTGRRVASPR